MFKRDIIEATTRFGLWRKIRRLKKEYPALEVLSKDLTGSHCTKQMWWSAIVRYDDGTPLPAVLDKTFVTNHFESEEKQLDFVDRNCISNYWLRDLGKQCNGEHVWAVTFKC